MDSANQQKIRFQTLRLTLLGLLFALAMAFSYLESMVVIPGLPPGIKLGLSNVVTMYCLFFLGVRSAYLLAIMKSCFVMLTRGLAGGLLSLAGGFLSVTVLAILTLGKKDRFSYPFLSIIGAVIHNVGQLVLARWLVSVFLYYYIPVLFLSGIVVGAVTGSLFQWILPYFPGKRSSEHMP